MDDTTRFALFGLAVPALMGGLVGAASARAARMAPPPGASGAACNPVANPIAVAVVLAILAGALTLVTYGVHGGIAWPPISSDDRLRFVPAVLVLIAVIALGVRFSLRNRKPRPTIPLDRVVGALAAGVGAAAGSAIALWPSAFTLERMLAIPASAAFAYASCLTLISFQEQQRRARAGVLLVGVAIAIGAALTGTGSLILGQYGFGASAVCAGVVFGGLALRGPTRPFTLAILCSFLATLLCCGAYLSDTPTWVVGLIACAIPFAWLVDAYASRRFGPRTAAAITIAVAALMCIVAVVPGIKSLADFAFGSHAAQTSE